MKLGCYKIRKTNRLKVFLSFTKADLALIGNPKGLDITLDDAIIEIYPGDHYSLRGNRTIAFPKKIVSILAGNWSPMRAQSINYKMKSGRFIVNAFDIMHTLEKGGEPPKTWKKEPLYSPDDNKSGEGIHFSKPMAPKTIYNIASEVDTYFSDGRYMNGHSDEQVAKLLGVSELSVSRVREDCFGAIKPDPKMDRLEEIQKVLRTLQEEMVELRK